METILRIEETVMVDSKPSDLEVDIPSNHRDRSAGYALITVCHDGSSTIIALTLAQQRLLAERLLQNVEKHEPPVAPQPRDTGCLTQDVSGGQILELLTRYMRETEGRANTAETAYADLVAHLRSAPGFGGDDE